MRERQAARALTKNDGLSSPLSRRGEPADAGRDIRQRGPAKQDKLRPRRRWPPGRREGSMKVRVIVNPRAGSGAALQKLPEIAAALKRQGLTDAEIVQTSKPGDASRLAGNAIADGVDVIGVVGGDGSLNEVSQAFLDGDQARTTLPKLALIPAGTGGDFKKTFGLPTDVQSVIANIKRGETRNIDLGILQLTNDAGELTTHAFLNICSFGLGGLTDRLVNEGPKWLGGTAAFFLGASRALVSYKNQPVVVKLDGEVWLQGPIINVALANGQFFGGGMHVAPKADPSDGLLDVVAIGNLGRAQSFAMTPKLYQGQHLDYPGVKYRRAKVVEAEPIFPWSEVLIDNDGETPGRLPLKAKLAPAAVPLVV